MKYIVKLAITFVLFLYCINSYAQDNDTLFIQRSEKGKVQFARFKVNVNANRKMQNDTIFLRSILHSNKEDEFKIAKEFTDELGIKHKRFQQYYKGLKVENAEYLLHGKDDNIEVINGDFQHINIDDVKPTFNEQQALEKALEFVGAKMYKWEDPKMERFVKQSTNNPIATYYPHGELLISKDLLTGSSVFKLSWKFQISSMLPSNEQLIYVDANNGNIINNVPLILDANTSCTAQTSYSGTQSITGDTYSGGIRLQETRNGVLIQTLNLNSTYNYSNATDFSNSNTNWISGSWPSFTQDQWALDAHWGTEKVLDYWSSVFNRNSVDGNSLRMLGYVHAGTNWENAQWVAGTNNHFMQYGDGYTIFKPLTSLDVAAHETGHGINEFTANLTPGTQESGALNEGLSDIWGASIEYWAAPTKQTWRIGEEIVKVTGYNCIRDIQNPKSTTAYEGQHPNTYHGTYWDYNGEPHCNSTVLSHWFYLLSQGGSGTNDIGHSYSVLGIGIDPAQRIAYKTEIAYLFSSSTYTDAMNASISAATDLSNGNANSIRVRQVKNAWYAVGLGTQPTQMSISGPWLLCSSGASYTIINPVVGALTWQMSSNISYVSGTNPAIFRANGYGYGPGWIQAYYDGLPGPIINVWSGTYESTPVTGQSGVCPNSIYNYTAQIPGAYSSVSWTYPSNWMKNNQYQNTVTLQTPMYNPAYGAVRVSITNQCGTSGYSGLTVYPGSCPHYFTIYPNPASNDITITMIDNSTYSTATDTIITNVNSNISTSDVPINFTIRIYNSQSALISSIKRSGTSFSVPLTNMRDGSYIIEVSDGKTSYTQTLIVKHN